MNTTTDDSTRFRRTRIIAWSIALVLYGGAAAVFVLNENLHRRTLWLDREEVDERGAEVRERARKREAKVRLERERIRLPDEDAKELREREEEKRRERALDRVERIEEAYEEVKRMEKHNLDILEKQRLEEFKERERNDYNKRTHRLHRTAELLEEDLREEGIEEELREELEEVLARTEEAKRAAVSTGELIEDPEQRAKLADASMRAKQAVEAMVTKAESVETPREGKSKKRLEHLAERAETLSRLADELNAMPETADQMGEHLAETPDPVDDADVMKNAARKNQLSTDELYDTAVEMEKKMNQRYGNARAAELATLRKSTFKEAKERLANTGNADRPNLGEKLRESKVENVGDLNEHRQTLDRALAEMENMRARAQNRANQLNPNSGKSSDPKTAPGQDIATRSMERKQQLRHVSHQQKARSLDLTGLMSSRGSEGGSGNRGAERLPDNRLTEEMVVSRALPGRRFTDEAFRKGWLYIDTWYIIGPWDLIPDTPQHLPPEMEIDLDAVYTNGKTGHPRHARTKERMDLDGTLKWQFHQSDKLFVRPPRETGNAIYFAYTELYFDRERDILVAIGIDDRSKVWVNDQVIWNHTAQSWRLGTTLRKVTFRKGYNTVLIRMENGAPLMDFSLVLCPPEALPGEG
ncbi:MAG: hypothetical protein WD708_05840 [Kiritimatiellia bacterium]